MTLQQQPVLAPRRHAAAAVAATFVVVLAALCLAAAAAATPAPSPAPTDLASARAQADQVRREVARLDHKAEVAIEKYNLARAELDDLNAQLISMRADLLRAQTQLDVARAVLGERMADIYKNGGISVFDILLNAADFTEIDTQIDYFQQINMADRDAVSGIEKLEAHVTRLTAQIEDDRARALEREQDLRGRRTDVEDQLAERRALLSDLDARVKELVRQQELRDAAAAQRLADSAGVDIESINGTDAQVAVVKETMKYLGIPYVWAGATPSGGFDCSGLVLYVYAKFGVSFPHGATMQAYQGTPVPAEQIQPADLVFFGTPAFYHHVGICIGNGLFIEAPHTGDVVKVSRLAGRGASLFCRYPIRIQHDQ
jgi:peptidoglycan DL-endopeptidase CwlO